MSFWLTDDEITELTGFKQNPRRVRALAELRPKVLFRVRSDGLPPVDREQFQGQSSSAQRGKINWDAADEMSKRRTNAFLRPK